MGATKRDYMDLHGNVKLEEIIQRYLLDFEKEMIYETLDCDISPKDIE